MFCDFIADSADFVRDMFKCVRVYSRQRWFCSWYIGSGCAVADTRLMFFADDVKS